MLFLSSSSTDMGYMFLSGEEAKVSGGERRLVGGARMG